MNSGKNIFFNKVAIVGVGLIGASFALALRENGLCEAMHGYGRRKENLERAKERGIIDDFSLDVRKACEDADLIFLSTPVGIFKDIIENIKGVLKKGALVTDAGSVKGRMVYELESSMPDGAYYIGSHPIAGSDKSGIDDARADLFNNARCIITPTDKSDESAKNKVAAIWETFGARVEFMNPFKHDEIYAAVSHFPHIVAYAIVNTIGDIDSKYIEYAGQGFKDTTRIALSSPEMWRDISIFNKENLINLMDVFKDNLDKLTKYLEEDNAFGIEGEFLKAQTLRKNLK
ncbi:MAG: prephenate dehydrogenase/arogenate dehydrogenase family protein [Nitrospiraceae bacterium]|nr:prephenate dehydrogenase/arogenate dehydrogenase family protein [Nitrospirota bacterium]MDA8213933.1 prephenate dehydrogenase/arogenate dehydrogenase family protein [Nitrospiraceae bacterium]MDA8337798.1 prephenate dehydrogenase/arogenate dehydrogenase family protein [Nitrospiraceae bacterium]